MTALSHAARRPRIAVVHFGIDRSFAQTGPSIRANIYTPAEQSGELRVFAHLFDLDRIENARSGESGALPDRIPFHPSQKLLTEPPDDCLAEWNFDELAQNGDTWNDGFSSARNLVHQLHSLRRATNLALEWQPDVVIFARPDLRYPDSLRAAIGTTLRSEGNLCLAPYWQRHRGGMNDRFAVVCGRDAIARYGQRIEAAADYCSASDLPLHSELLLAYAMTAIPSRQILVRAVRVRVGGQDRDEDFAVRAIVRTRTAIHKSGIHPKVKRLAYKGASIADAAIQTGIGCARWANRQLSKLRPTRTFRPLSADFEAGPRSHSA